MTASSPLTCCKLPALYSSPSLTYKVDTAWRKDVLKDVNIYVCDKKDHQNLELPDSLPKIEKDREWTDIGIQELLGKYLDGGKKAP